MNAEYDGNPLKGCAASGNTSSATQPTSFQVMHPPPVQPGQRTKFAAPMKLQAASSWFYEQTTPAYEGADTTPRRKSKLANTTPRTGSGKTYLPRPPAVATRPGSAATLMVRLQDNPRAVIEAQLPHLVGAPNAFVLRELEADREAAEQKGELLRAQERNEMLRAFAEYSGREAERNIAAQQEHCPELTEKAAHYRNLMFEFTNMWEEEFRRYDEKAEAALLKLEKEQQQRFEERESLLRSELAAKRIHYSRKVLTKREELEKLLSLRQYKEADRIRRDIIPMEEAEECRFEESLNATLAAKTKTLRRSQCTKMDALKMRIVQGREDLMLQRRTDYFNLLLKHANGIEETQQSVRRHAATERKYLQKQLSAMLIRSASKPVHFESILAGDG